jgi:hypothetical protein
MNINEISEKINLNQFQEKNVIDTNKYSNNRKDIKPFSSEFEFPKNEDIEELNDENDQEECENTQEEIINLIDVKIIQNIQDISLKDKNYLQIKDVDSLNFLIKNNRLSKKDEIHLDITGMTKDDAEFLKLLSSKADLAINSVNTENTQIQLTVNNQNALLSYKTLDFSKGLYNLVEHAYNTQKPVRVSFDGDSSVILKIGADGKLSAEFLSNDKAMQYILKNNIPELRNKFDNEGIPYKEISYKDQSKRQNKKNKNGGS